MGERCREKGGGAEGWKGGGRGERWKNLDLGRMSKGGRGGRRTGGRVEKGRETMLL